MMLDENNKQVTIKLFTRNLDPVEKHKVEEAFKQFLLKTKDQNKKFKRRIKRIIKENEK